MKVIEAGHTYELDDGSVVQFVKRVEGGEMIAGTSNEELLEVLLHRTKFFQISEHKCEENSKGINAMARALFWFCTRHQRRKHQGVLSTDLPHKS